MNADGIRQSITELISGLFGTNMFANVVDILHNSMNLGVNITDDVVASLNLNTGDGLIATFSLMLQYVLTFVKFLIPWLGISVIKICLQFLCYSCLFEIMIRTVIAPVALGDIFTEGTNKTGFKFLKSYFAMCLQEVIIYVICLVFSVISYDILPIKKLNW